MYLKLKRVLNEIENNKDVSILGLYNSSKSFLISLIPTKPSLIITPSIKEAYEFYDDLSFFLGEGYSISIYPSIKAYDTTLLHPRFLAQRVESLYKLLNYKNTIVISSIEGILNRVIPKDILNIYIEYIEVGEELEREEFINRLYKIGYTNSTIVEDIGEFSVRGGIIDIFPPSYRNPLRIEFVGDIVESIREFDVNSQRSVNIIGEAIILPSREIIFDKKYIDFAIKKLNQDFSNIKEIESNIVNSIYFPGIESYLPLFYEGLNTIFDYLPSFSHIIIDNPMEIERILNNFWDGLNRDYNREIFNNNFLPNPSDICIFPKEFNSLIQPFQKIKYDDIEGEGAIKIDVESNKDIRNEIVNSEDRHFKPLVDRILNLKEIGIRSYIISHTMEQGKRIASLLSDYGIDISISQKSFPEEKDNPDYLKIIIGKISNGFYSQDLGINIISEEEIFGEKRGFSRHKKVKSLSFLSNLSELKIDDFVVHTEHGIGIFKGLKKLEIYGKANDYLLLEYSDGDKLYVPIDRINLVQKYIGGDGHTPNIDKLGGKSWNRIKKRVKESIQKIAIDLIRIYANREVSNGYSFSKGDKYYEEFEASFPYDETEDQIKAIEDVISDMEESKPMDRLICGDVGYGKTEVAMRAAFKAVMDGKQVAVLVPTTILAHQHFRTFKERFDPYPVRIEMLSRFKSLKEQKNIIEDLKKGIIDIIIGTHRLLQRDIAFKDLGLLIIDEEHRFGVMHKEKIKKMRVIVDVLTLSATPIPRTLNLSLTGIRDLSIINTPPADRLSIRTYLLRFDKNVIKEAIINEIRRGGQIFFVHNRVKSIYSVANFLKKLVPDVEIGIAHGQMKERELERVMVDYVNRRYNLLVTTAIIESGLDIPSANTIIINNAHKFGLAQLYQLRGRVGRSSLRAYAYLLIPSRLMLSKDVQKRLKALLEFTELGSGFKIAMHDLEIRGAGNILGVNQSGHIDAVGYEMYLQLLEKAIRELKGEEIYDVDPEIKLGIEAYIPDEYILDTSQKLIFYKRLASSISEEDIDDIKGEFIDRYGPLPNTLNNLLYIIIIKILLKRLYAKEISYERSKILIYFNDISKLNREKLFNLLKKNKRDIILTKDYKLIIDLREKEYILPKIIDILKEIS